MAENPTPTPGEYVRGKGPDQLGYGDATETNEELAAGDAVEETIADQALVSDEAIEPQAMEADVPVEYADEEEPDYRPVNEIDEILFGESQGIGVNPYKETNKPVPASILRALPQLSAIVADPTTPPAIKAAYQLLIDRLAAELEAKY